MITITLLLLSFPFDYQYSTAYKQVRHHVRVVPSSRTCSRLQIILIVEEPISDALHTVPRVLDINVIPPEVTNPPQQSVVHLVETGKQTWIVWIRSPVFLKNTKFQWPLTQQWCSDDTHTRRKSSLIRRPAAGVGHRPACVIQSLGHQRVTCEAQEERSLRPDLLWLVIRL